MSKGKPRNYRPFYGDMTVWQILKDIVEFQISKLPKGSRNGPRLKEVLRFVEDHCNYG